MLTDVMLEEKEKSELSGISATELTPLVMVNEVSLLNPALLALRYSQSAEVNLPADISRLVIVVLSVEPMATSSELPVIGVPPLMLTVRF